MRNCAAIRWRSATATSSASWCWPTVWGSGVKANILSTLTSTIICEMMAEGATLQEAVDTITATLPQCQERGIAYSTFTIVQIYYDGTAPSD